MSGRVGDDTLLDMSLPLPVVFWVPSATVPSSGRVRFRLLPLPASVGGSWETFCSWGWLSPVLAICASTASLSALSSICSRVWSLSGISSPFPPRGLDKLQTREQMLDNALMEEIGRAHV